jgi:hypothetical protein
MGKRPNQNQTAPRKSPTGGQELSKKITESTFDFREKSVLDPNYYKALVVPGRQDGRKGLVRQHQHSRNPYPDTFLDTTKPYRCQVFGKLTLSKIKF